MKAFNEQSALLWARPRESALVETLLLLSDKKLSEAEDYWQLKNQDRWAKAMSEYYILMEKLEKARLENPRQDDRPLEFFPGDNY